MVRKSSVIIFISLIFSMIVTFLLPINAITLFLKDYGVISKKEPYYTPSNISSFKSLNLECEVGNVEISYVYPPNEELVSIIILIEMAGKSIAHKSYLDYFNITANYDGTSFSFKMNIKSNLNLQEVKPLIKESKMLVTIRADAVISINAEIVEGDISIDVPYGVILENLWFKTTLGNIVYNMNECYIGNNITGVVGEGDIELSLFNVQYTHNSVWNLTNGFEHINSRGSILININQIIGMSANVTGIITTYAGIITLYYYDINPNIGAVFTFHNTANTPGPYEGFDQNSEINLEEWWISRLIYHSNDFPRLENYNLSFYKIMESSEFHMSIVNL